MLTRNGGRECDYCYGTIEDDQFVGISVPNRHIKGSEHTYHFHRSCADERIVCLVATDTGQPVGSGRLIGARRNQYHERVNDDGSWIRRPGTVQCQSCGAILGDSEMAGDPDCQRCEYRATLDSVFDLDTPSGEAEEDEDDKHNAAIIRELRGVLTDPNPSRM